MKMKTTLVSLFSAMFIGTTGYVGYQTYQTNMKINESELLLENIEVLANGEASGGYAWSDPIDCTGIGTGDYCVCEEDGPGNSCSSPGSKTCDCGRNC